VGILGGCGEMLGSSNGSLVASGQKKGWLVVGLALQGKTGEGGVCVFLSEK